MAGETAFGDEYKVYIDTAFDAGGAWGTETWVELECALEIDEELGFKTAKFPFRGRKLVSAKKSERREPEVTITCGKFKGDPAYDRIREAAFAEGTDPANLLHVRFVEGDNDVAGNEYWEADFIVTPKRETPTDDGFQMAFSLMPAADSENTPVLDGLTSAA